ncbi:MAG: crossover junction endodeoxyribonuclease RuvC [Armatimonadetes bacterium]|nr:crossover junction endodeoxyribonuclease RuvC [Armatimonadota bacterium]
MGHPREYILGVDPGLKVTGYGVVRRSAGRIDLVEGGLVKTDLGAPLAERLQQLHRQLTQVLESFPPETVVVEDLYSQYAHPRTAILMGHARGVVYLAAAEAGAAVVAYPPALVKRSLTGNGRAPKDQVGRMVAQLLGLAEPPRPEDVTDALALALCHCVPSREKARRRVGRRAGLPAEVLERVQDAVRG